MRHEFAKCLYEEMQNDSSIYLLTADLGYGLWDKIRDDFPDRFYNVGSSEMTMVGMAVGLAMEGKKPFAYSITPFALYRPFEVIRNYIDHEKIPVCIVGGGRGRDYGYLGFSHWADDDCEIMACFKNITHYRPDYPKEVESTLRHIISRAEPTYINLCK